MASPLLWCSMEAILILTWLLRASMWDSVLCLIPLLILHQAISTWITNWQHGWETNSGSMDKWLYLLYVREWKGAAIAISRRDPRCSTRASRCLHRWATDRAKPLTCTSSHESSKTHSSITSVSYQTHTSKSGRSVLTLNVDEQLNIISLFLFCFYKKF